MNGSIEERAAAAKLSKKDRKILDYILKNKKRACFQTASEIAAILEVSPSSVVRLPKKLHYGNFAQFKRTLQKEVAELASFDQSETVPYEKIKEYEYLPDGEVLAAYSRNVLNNIKSDISAGMDKKLAETADLIVKARSVYIVGFRSCYGFASTMGIMMSCMRPGVIVVGDNRPMVDSLIDIGAKDVMIAISFTRYSSSTAFAAAMALDAGCPVIALTDSYASPIARGAKKTVINSIENMSFFDSYVSLVMNMEKIMLLVSKRSKKTNEARLMRMEKYLEKTGEY